jgi:hypothetical protein
MNLAEHMGEISLIPRNPDDEEAASTAEFASDDLLSDGGKSSRKQEQGGEKVEAKKPTPVSSLLAAIQEHVLPPKPPFQMEIVEAQDVREMLFDAVTGKPIRDPADPVKPGKSGSPSAPHSAAAPAANVAPTAPAAPSTDSDGPAAAANSDGQEQSFPIDLGETEEELKAVSHSLAQ